MWIYIAVAVMVGAGIAFGAPGFYYVVLLVGGASVIQASRRKSNKNAATAVESNAPVDVAVNADSVGTSKPKEVVALQSQKHDELEESWNNFQTSVDASQSESVNRPETMVTGVGAVKDVGSKKWMPSAVVAAGVVGFLLFFHIVPAHLVIFPKQFPSFANTFVAVDDYLEQYNSTNFIGQIALGQTYLHQQLVSRKLIVNRSAAPVMARNASPEELASAIKAIESEIEFSYNAALLKGVRGFESRYQVFKTEEGSIEANRLNQRIDMKLAFMK